MNVQWYPGHMAKTKRMMQEQISLVDVVIELVDARIPMSSKNPDMDTLARNKHRIMVLNKADLADQAANEKWAAYYRSQGFAVVLADSVKGKGMQDITSAARELMAEKIQRLKAKGRIFVPIRAMIVGIPNVGKSTLINKYVGKAVANTGDKPGVTRSKQWVRIKKDFELLDTPGILWPKFEDPQAGIKMAITGAVNDQILDRYSLSLQLIELLKSIKPEVLKERYKVDFSPEEKAEEIHRCIGEARGFKMKGGWIDKERTSIVLLDEFRGCKIARITLEQPPVEAP